MLLFQWTILIGHIIQGLVGWGGANRKRKSSGSDALRVDVSACWIMRGPSGLPRVDGRFG